MNANDLPRSGLSLLAILLLSVASACDDSGSAGGTSDTGGSDADSGGDVTADTVGDTSGADAAPDAVPDQGADTSPLVLRDLTVNMTEMDPHTGQLMEFRVVSADGVLAARGFLDPLGNATATFQMLNAVPEGAFTLDFTADLNENGDYDVPPADHAWRLPLPASGDATVDFRHEIGSLVDIGASAATEGGDFALAIANLDPHVGQRFELRVIDELADREVGRYILAEVPTANFILAIPGIITDGVFYVVDFYADFNGNGRYDPPSIDHAWRMTGTGGPDGLSLSFRHNVNFTDIGF